VCLPTLAGLLQRPSLSLCVETGFRRKKPIHSLPLNVHQGDGIHAEEANADVHMNLDRYLVGFFFVLCKVAKVIVVLR
jgi:hypothetical protein